MRIVEIDILNAPPIERFAIDDLGDQNVVAGRNGVGKTRLFDAIIAKLTNPSSTPQHRLILEPTSSAERDAWGATSLDLNDSQMSQQFMSVVQQNRRRRHWESAILKFEGDRRVAQIQPLAFQFDFEDPEEEALGWNSSFQPLEGRFQDVMHTLVKLLVAQDKGIASRARKLRSDGHDSMNLAFDDPLARFKDAFAELLPGKRMLDPDKQQSQLRYEDEGQEMRFPSLSSGEREVVTIAFDLLVRRPRDCLIFFDEPELHLHPELASRLLRVLSNIGDRNQFFYATHSPDIISGALQDRVIFLQPPEGDANQAVVADETDETNQALRHLGHSLGVIALGKKLVLIEGESASVDKEVYARLVDHERLDLVLIPSGGKHLHLPFAELTERVLNRTLWGVDFFMLSDGDTAAPTAPDTGRYRLLPRYHLENFFLDSGVWAKVFSQLEPTSDWLVDQAQIDDRLRAIAKRHLSYAVALEVAAEVRQRAGNIDVMPSNAHSLDIRALGEAVVERLDEESSRLSSAMDPDLIAANVTARYEELARALDSSDSQWTVRIPGKPILASFIAETPLRDGGSARRLYMRACLEDIQNSPFAPIVDILRSFAR